MANYNLFDAASLAMVPVGYKENKLYSVKPDTGDGDFDFTRASAATRVNADGNIEKETGNLILQSNSFTSGNWFNQNSTIASGQAGYDGSSDAWLLSTTNVAASECRVRQDSMPIITGVQSLSVYAKAGTLNVAYLQIVEGSNNLYFLINLDNGTTNYIIGQGNTPISVASKDIGGGWYRLTGTWNSSSATASVRVGITNSLTNPYLTSSGGETIYIQDAQLEQGLVARDYIETTTSAVYGGITDNVPRLDYTDSSCPALLLEPLRTNSISQSEYIASWAGANTTIVTNSAISPEGVQNSSSVTFASGGYWYKSVSLSYSAGQAFTWSIYATTQDQVTRWGSSTPAGTDTFSVVDAGNGWYRQSITRVVSGSGSANFQPLMDWVFVGVGTTFNVYGAQLEAGAYPTSYIPTYGSSVSRVVDKPLVNPQNLLGAKEGTWFMNFADMSFDVSGTSGPSVYIGYNQSNYLGITNRSLGNVNQVLFCKRESGSIANLHTIVSQSGNDKFCFTWNGSSLKLFVNGVKVYDQNDFANFIAWDELILGNDARTPQYNAKQTFLFPTQLTDNELAALTRPYDTYQEWVDGEGLTWESKSCTTQSIIELQNI